MVDDVFGALHDPARRALLDALRRRDGRTVSELAREVPRIGRHTVLRHLGVLESVDLIRTVKVGRERRCYLNPVPLVDLARRWLDDFGAGWGLALTSLRDAVERSPEQGALSPMPHPRHIHSVVIAATREAVWTALTDPATTGRWHFAPAQSTWRPGDGYRYDDGDGNAILSGTILEAEPPSRLVQTFVPAWDNQVRGEPASRVTWTLEQDGALCRLTVVHEGVPAGSATETHVSREWPYLLSNLKTLLETGRTLDAA